MQRLTRSRGRGIAAPVLTCGGSIHQERGELAVLDLRARDRRSRVALAEDGAAFCGSCAIELARGGDDGQ